MSLGERPEGVKGRVARCRYLLPGENPGCRELEHPEAGFAGTLTPGPLSRAGVSAGGRGDAADPHLSDLLDRTLKSFDQLKDLAEALRKIDTRPRL